MGILVLYKHVEMKLNSYDTYLSLQAQVPQRASSHGVGKVDRPGFNLIVLLVLVAGCLSTTQSAAIHLGIVRQEHGDHLPHHVAGHAPRLFPRGAYDKIEPL